MERFVRRGIRRFSGYLLGSVSLGLLTLAGTAAAGAGKQGAAKKPASAPSDAVVATYQGGQVTLAEIQALLDRQRSPYLLRQLQTPEGRRRYVERIVENRILADEARRRGIDKEPEIRARIDGVLASALIQRLRMERRNTTVSDEEARKYYQQHKEEFSRPARKRIARILLRAGTPADLEKKMQTAKKLLEQIQKAGPHKMEVFRQLARKYSDDAYGKRRGGYYGLISTSTKPSPRYPQAVLDAAAKLQKPGDVSGVVRTPEGLQILMMEGKIPAYKESIERALPLIKARLRARRLGDVKTLAADVFEKAHLTINEKALSQLRVPAVRTPRLSKPPRPHVVRPRPRPRPRATPQPPPAPKKPAANNAPPKKR